jgi:hypothetical protein
MELMIMDVDANTFICPQPLAWERVFQVLLKHSEGSSKVLAPPPKPLILAGWAYSSDSEKLNRWNETLLWAKKYGASDLIPVLSADERYCGH